MNMEGVTMAVQTDADGQEMGRIAPAESGGLDVRGPAGRHPASPRDPPRPLGWRDIERSA